MNHKYVNSQDRKDEWINKEEKNSQEKRKDELINKEVKTIDRLKTKRQRLTQRNMEKRKSERKETDIERANEIENERGRVGGENR